VLPDAVLDYSSAAEARLLRSGRSGLQLVSESRHLRIYELPDAAPIVSAPAGADAGLIRLGSSAIEFSASAPGRYLVRVRYTPYWKPVGAPACVSSAPDGMTEVRTPAAGLVDLRLEPSFTTVADAVTSTGSSC
jgi:hypothetical protein